MKKIVIIAIMILGIVSCKSKGDEPTPVQNNTVVNNSNIYMKELNNTTWLLVDVGDNKGSYFTQTNNYINPVVNKQTLSYKDSTLTLKQDGKNITWTATYYLDKDNWLYYYYNPKKQYSVFESFGLQYNISGNIMYQTNSSGEYQKYLKQ